MAVQMLLIDFKFTCSQAEYIHAMAPLANDILEAPGLRWKIWLINESQSTAGGIYLFDDSSYVQLFLTSPLIANLKRHSALADLRVMPFDVLEAETALTHGPLGKGAKV